MKGRLLKQVGDEVINFILWTGMFGLGYIYRLRQRLKRPVLVIFTTLLDPLIN